MMISDQDDFIQAASNKEIETHQKNDALPKNTINSSKAVPTIPLDSSSDNSSRPVKPPGSITSRKPSNRMLQTNNKPSIYYPTSQRIRQKKKADPRRNKQANYKTPRTRNNYQNVDNLSSATLEYLNNPVAIPKEPGELQKVVQELENLRSFHVQSQNYPEAEGIQKLIQSAKKKIKYIASNPPEVESSVIKHKELQQVVQRILTQWNEQYDEFVQTTETEYAELIAKHEKELNDFDANSPEELTPQYRKRSVALLESRNKEHILANNHQFEAAKQLRAKNDEIESKEAMRQYERMQNDYLKRREKLISQQEEQVRVFLSHADSARTKMLQTRANLLQGYLKRMEKLNTEIAELCETQKIDPDTLVDINLPIDRVVKIENIELEGSPIPTMRQGTFTSIRQQIRRRQKKRKEEEKKGEEEEGKEKEEENVQPFVTVSNSVDEFKEVDADIKEEEEEVFDEKIEEEEEETKEEEIINDHQEEEEIINDHQEEEVIDDHQEEEEIIDDHQEEEEVVVYGRNDVTDMTFFTSTIAAFANDGNEQNNSNEHKMYMDPNEENENDDEK